MRVATIDIGTNAVLLLVAEPSPDGSMRAVAERATITRLGQGVDRSRAFAADAVSRTLTCLEAYASVVRDAAVERIAIVGTSAMRDARGGEELRRSIRTIFGVDARILSGDEEARIGFAGGLDGLDLPTNKEVAMFDIGGGSTEVVLGRQAAPEPKLSYVESFDVGSVRLTERHIRSDPPSAVDLGAICKSASAAFARVPPLTAGTTPVGVAGTVTTLAAVAFSVAPYVGARVHGTILPVETLRRTIQKLEALDVSSRRRVVGMEPNRADVIVAGGYIALALLDHWQAGAVRVSDRGLRWGLARELLRTA
jgi:exopolyphosphatase/guanosine-5'-triphosphate,3'-diphosphate pyrophosphatase